MAIADFNNPTDFEEPTEPVTFGRHRRTTAHHHQIPGTAPTAPHLQMLGTGHSDRFLDLPMEVRAARPNLAIIPAPYTPLAPATMA
jgi:hypothetical protein